MSKELLSAAVDAAATEAEWDALLEAMDRDTALKAEWSRRWSTRDARDGTRLAGSTAFCSGVMAAIAQEAPLPSNVVAFPKRAAAPATRARLPWKTLVPVSAAAGVVAAVLVVGGLGGREPIRSEVVASAAPSLETTPVRFTPEAAPGRVDEGRTAILNAYLMEHSNTLAERSMGGALANARFAARTADYRPDSP